MRTAKVTTLTALCAISGTLLFASCAAKEDDDSSSSDDGLSVSSLTDDATLMGSAASDMGQAALEAVSVNEGSAGRAGTFTRDKSCETSGSSALVEIHTTFTKTIEAENVSKAITGESEENRTWSRSGGSVTCTGDHAAIDWTTPGSLSMTSEFERQRTMTITRTLPRQTLTLSRTIESSGTRTITWSDASTTSVEFESTRSMKMENSKGKSKEIELSLATKEDAPLSVTTVRTSGVLASRTIASGTVVATGEKGRIETAFTNFVTEFEGTIPNRVCTPTSGSFSVTAYDAGGDEIKAYTVSIADGVATMTEDGASSGTAIELPTCDPEDSNE